jgi:hypothetical protein
VGIPSPSQCKGTGPLLAGAKEAGEPARAGEDRFGFGLSHFDWQEFFGSFFKKERPSFAPLCSFSHRRSAENDRCMFPTFPHVGHVIPKTTIIFGVIDSLLGETSKTH